MELKFKYLTQEKASIFRFLPIFSFFLFQADATIEMYRDIEVQSWDPEVFSTMAMFLFSLFNLWFYTTDTVKSYGLDTQLLQYTF